MLRLKAFLLAFAILLTTHVHAQEFDIPTVDISGGGLPQAISLAPADADAFRRRVNLLPRLEETPDVSGERYTVTTGYWPEAIRLESDEDSMDVSQDGDYYPDGGYVRVTIEGEDVWQVLSLRQRAILDRYIRLAHEGLIGERPSTLDILAASAESEAFGVSLGGSVLDSATSAALLTALADANPDPRLDPRRPPTNSEEGRWLTVTLLEGRTLRYYYDGTALTEGLGTERYDASSVAEMLADIAPADLPVIEQEEPAGSLVWWPLMVGGGLSALGIAAWLRARNRHR